MDNGEKRIAREKSQRVNFLLRELQYEILDAEEGENSICVTFQDSSDFTAFYFIDSEANFFEFCFVFSFSPDFNLYLLDRMEEVLHICYEFGVYFSITNNKDEISLNIYSKVYFSGLNFHLLNDTLDDFKLAADNLSLLLDIQNDFIDNA